MIGWGDMMGCVTGCIEEGKGKRRGVRVREGGEG